MQAAAMQAAAVQEPPLSSSSHHRAAGAFREQLSRTNQESQASPAAGVPPVMSPSYAVEVPREEALANLFGNLFAALTESAEGKEETVDSSDEALAAELAGGGPADGLLRSSSSWLRYLPPPPPPLEAPTALLPRLHHRPHRPLRRFRSTGWRMRSGSGWPCGRTRWPPSR